MPLSKPGLHCMSLTPSRDKHLESQKDEPRELRATPRLRKSQGAGKEPDHQREWADAPEVGWALQGSHKRPENPRRTQPGSKGKPRPQKALSQAECDLSEIHIQVVRFLGLAQQEERDWKATGKIRGPGERPPPDWGQGWAR